MIETIHWHTLHPRYLDTELIVLDLGANYGEFSRAITERFGCHCVAVEPSPEVFAAIPRTPQISKLQLAIASKSGTMPFHIANSSLASSLWPAAAGPIRTIEVQAISLPDLLSLIGCQRVDLIKIDIEGAEIDVLAACPDEVLKNIAQISVEFHDFCHITDLSDVKRTLQRLRRLGFFSVRMSRVGHQDTWLINRRLLHISDLELICARHLVRNWMGFQRVMGRQFKRWSALQP